MILNFEQFLILHLFNFVFRIEKCSHGPIRFFSQFIENSLSVLYTTELFKNLKMKLLNDKILPLPCTAKDISLQTKGNI